MLTTSILVAKAAQWLLNGAMLACPITWIVIGIMAVGAAIALIINLTNKYANTNISAVGVIVALFASAGALIWNIFSMVFNVAFSVADGIWNVFAALANFWGMYLWIR